jgi:hypothetical protein
MTNQGKVQAGAEWSTPQTVKQLQTFLGRVAVPLTELTSPATRFSWTSEADAAFRELKRRFTSAPALLINPDPARQFVVEVDAFDSGVGAGLSQQSASDQKLHQCAFCARSLSC